MADYRRMYAILCAAIDSEIDALKAIPLACPSANRLEAALHKTEEIYIETSLYAEKTENENLIALYVQKSDVSMI